jgi:hypothetical protein
MLCIADTHVHIYPCYNLQLFFSSAFTNLRARLAEARHAFPVEGPTPEKLALLFLTERFDCRYFQGLSEGRIQVPGLSVVPRGQTLLEVSDGRESLLLVSGRQVITRERLEVLALNCRGEIADGQSIDDALTQIERAGGRAVLNWSLGKWMFARGRIIERLVKESAPERFLVGDIAGRPLGWPEPPLLRLARERGFVRVRGSDPLPLIGAEKGVGRYASACRLSLSATEPLAAVRHFLFTQDLSEKAVGRRDKFPTVVIDFVRNEVQRRSSRRV